MDIQLEKNIPIPHRYAPRGILAKAMKAMEIGDSFVLNGLKAKSDATTVRHTAKKLGIKMTIRAIEGEGYRAWRIE